MNVFFTIFGGPHDGYRFSPSIPMDYVSLEERPQNRDYCASISYWPKPLKIIHYKKKRMFVQKYGKTFFKDIYAFNDYEARKALMKFRHYFNPVYKKQDHLRVVF